MSEIYKEKFGVDIPKKISELENLCAEKNVEHKDFSKRNILIEWNFDEWKPLKNKEKKSPNCILLTGSLNQNLLKNKNDIFLQRFFAD